MQKVKTFTKILDNGTVCEYYKFIAHKFRISDVEDPDLFAGEELYKWQESDSGKFVMENSLDKPMWTRHIEHSYYTYHITAEMSGERMTEYILKFGKKN